MRLKLWLVIVVVLSLAWIGNLLWHRRETVLRDSALTTPTYQDWNPTEETRTSSDACPPPQLSIRLALVGNEYLQQFPVTGYGGIERAVENTAWGVWAYMERARKERFGEWCANGWVEITEFMVVVPKRSQTTDLNGKPYPFEVVETACSPRAPTSQYIREVRDILESKRPDAIWSQSGWSADGLISLNIPIICTIHDSGTKTFSFENKADKHILHYQFRSRSHHNTWAVTEGEREVSSYCWPGLDDNEFELGPANDRQYYLYVSGNWGRQKGIDEVLRLAELNPNDEFRAYGSNDLEGELARFAQKHPNFKHFRELQRGHDHAEAFKHAKALLMFTHLDEAFGMVTIEAFSKGTPVFGSTRGANVELITPEFGFLSDDIEEVNRHLHDAYNHTRIYELAKKRHHVRTQVTDMLSLTRDMITKAL